MVSLALVEHGEVWVILARLAWEGGTLKPFENKTSEILPPWEDLFPRRTVKLAKPSPTAIVAAALLEKIKQITPGWVKQISDKIKHMGTA